MRRVLDQSADNQQADVLIYFDGDLLAGIVLDAVQDTFPYYGGTIADRPALTQWSRFVKEFHEADLEFDYCPHHPHEGPYEESDLAAYIKALSALKNFDEDLDLDHPWLSPWKAVDPATLESYLRFLDFRRWRAVTKHGEIVEGISLPPSLDLQTRRFYFRP